MLESRQESIEEPKIELGTGVHWPAVFGLALVVVVVVGVLGAACLVVARLPAPKTDADTASSSSPAPGKVVRHEPPRHLAMHTSVRQEVPVKSAVVEPQRLPDVVPQIQPAPSYEALRFGADETVRVASTGADPTRLPPHWSASEQSGFHLESVCSEAELHLMLGSFSHEVDVETGKGGTATQKVFETARNNQQAKKGKNDEELSSKARSKRPAIMDLIADRDDLRGLPVRNLPDCQSSEKDAAAKGAISQEVRREFRSVSRRRSEDSNFDQLLIDAAALKYVSETKKWTDHADANMLAQMFSTNGAGVRTQVAKSLAAISDQAAGESLARLAVFDLNEEVRKQAVSFLKKRPAAEWRPTLVAALRYPWSPVADHAAAALVKLKDRRAVLELAQHLDEPDPSRPKKNSEGKWQVAELVRVNHLANCVLCHAPSLSDSDPMRGVVPDRDQPLPEVYYEARRGDFVRADITYIRQDFSIMQIAESSPLGQFSDRGKPGLSDGKQSKASQWPVLQRFDYMVRLRDLTEEEVARVSDGGEQTATDYPQRRAVLWALCELTGQNMGSRAEDWRDYLEKVYASPDP